MDAAYAFGKVVPGKANRLVAGAACTLGSHGTTFPWDAVTDRSRYRRQRHKRGDNMMIKQYAQVEHVRKVFNDVGMDYPFTHMSINDDGHLVFKRWLHTRDLKVEISYIYEENSLIVFVESRYSNKYEMRRDIWSGALENVPSDEYLLQLVRQSITWE